MTENTIKLCIINELSEFSFYIPSYQRGYRWSEQQVSDLLTDIHEFKPKDIPESDDKTWYCLQPIVVKSKSDSFFEVIDGQQRLTTIFLILHYLNQDYVENKRDKLFTIEYETRKKFTDILPNLSEYIDDNIDFFHIGKAYAVIEKWFETRDGKFDKNAYRSKLKFNTKVIWYEISEPDTISVFTRLNIGKISLTNAELIKALFLNSSNFRDSDKNSLRLRQIEISNEWDNIEKALQNDKLWYFLNDYGRADNRIEFIFDLMNDKNTEDPYATFRFFHEKLKNTTEIVLKEQWEEVQFHYQTFNEWFNERSLYHKIGFILQTNLLTLKTLYSESSHVTKKEFRSFLDETIKKHYHSTELMALEYDDPKTSGVLLLYNILTMLKNDHEDAYFPFDSFKKMKWNKEHISSVKDSAPFSNRTQWLIEVKSFVDTEKPDGTEILNKIETALKKESCESDDIFMPLYTSIIDHFNQELKDGDVNGITNLALLDETTNKSYKNAVFPVKRKRIIELDKSGGFVPICTKNTFLKYFSDYPPKISFWCEDDKKMYEKDLKDVLSEFMEVT